VTRQLPTIVVVGSANVDMIVQNDRLPRPGETIAGGRFRTAGGGKGANQAIAARRLGAQVALVGRVGDDGPGRLLRDSMGDEGLDLTHLRVAPDDATGVALILVDRDGQNMISVASGANSRVTAADVQSAAALLDTADAVVCQLEIPLAAVGAALAAARQHGITTILNPAPAQPIPEEIVWLIDWLIPNELEASALTGVEVRDPAGARAAGRVLLDRGALGVVVTLGHQGALMVTVDRVETIAAADVEAIDATAAGDAFTAAFAVSLARGLSPREALVYANAAGGLATTRPGAQPSLPNHAEVTGLLDRSNG
jgi:ribokinase